MRAHVLLLFLGGCSYTPPETGAATDTDAMDGSDPGAEAGALACPQDFTLTGSSRYKVFNGGGNNSSWWTAEASCEALGVGIHLAVPDDPAETAALASILTGARSYYIGFVQPNGALFTQSDWHLWTGGEVFGGWELGEPDDAAVFGDVDNDVEQFGVIRDGMFRDANGDVLQEYVCECDGKSKDASLQIPPQ